MTEARGGFLAAMRGLVPSLFLDVALPLVTYYVLTGQGMGTVLALVLSGLWPLLSIVVTVIRRRRLEAFGLFILVCILIGAATSLLFHDARFVLLKDSAFTGTIGLFFLATMFARRPIMFYFGQKFGTDGSPEALARWDGYWTGNAVFRHGQQTMTVVWGLAFVAEALVRVALAFVVPLSIMVAISNIMPFVVVAALIFWTIGYARRNAAASRAAAAAAAATQPA